MNVEQLAIPGLLLFKPRVFRDARGRFVETWRADAYREAGLTIPFVQDNSSTSARGTVRGLHYQHPHSQGKLVTVLQGRVFDVAVDIRRGSPNFRQWVGVELSDENGHQFWIPPGFAHGFAVLSEGAVFSYKCTDYYRGDCDRAVRWNDPTIGIDWPIDDPVLSVKDASAPLVHECLDDLLPEYLP